MHNHNVYFWLKEGLADEDIRLFEEGLRSLTEERHVDRGSFGRPASTEVREVVDNSYSYGLNLSFADGNAHDAYQVSDIHNVFVERNSGKWERVVVYDVAS